jgi:hypothetical protein
MNSLIDPTKPTSVQAYTADVRTNFAVAAEEITALQAIAALQQSAAALAHWGFVGNGLGTTLGEVYPTLAAAQAVYPHAIALTDTFDWAAIQAVINAAPVSQLGVTIVLPPGDTIINETISSGNQPFAMWGAGQFGSRIFLNAPVDLFRHGMGAGQPSTYAPFDLHNLAIQCNTAGAGWLINIRQNPTYGHFYLENLAVGATNEVGLGNFTGWINAVGITTTKIRNCQFAGGTFNPDLTHAVQVGLCITSDDNTRKAFDIVIDNSYMDCVQNCIQANIVGLRGNNGSVEGIKVLGGGGTTIVGAYLKISIPNAADVWQPPFHVFSRWNYQGSGTILDADALQDVYIERCTLYVTADPTGYVSVSDLVRFGHATAVWFVNNDCHLFAGAVINSFVSVGLNADGSNSPGINNGPMIRIENNLFNVITGAVATAGITVASTTLDVQAFGNRYRGSIWTPLPWNSSVNYVVNQLVHPTVANGFLYICTVAGTSGTTEPVWPTSAGTVADGTVTWSFNGSALGIHGIPQLVGPVGGLEAESGLDVTGTFLTVSYNSGGSVPLQTPSTAPSGGGKLALATNYLSGQAEVDYWNCYAGAAGGLSHTFWQLVSNGASPPVITPARLVDIDRTGQLTTYGALTASGGYLTIGYNANAVLPAAGAHAAMGYSYQNSSEVDYWSCSTVSAVSHIFWQVTSGAAVKLMDISPVGRVQAYGGLTSLGAYFVVNYNASGVIPVAGAQGAWGWNYNGNGEVDHWSVSGVSSQAHIFWQRTSGGAATRLMDINTTGQVTAYNGFALMSPTGPNIRSGTGAASGTQPKGSLWMRTDGAVGSTLYVSQGGGTWNAIAGV